MDSLRTHGIDGIFPARRLGRKIGITVHEQLNLRKVAADSVQRGFQLTARQIYAHALHHHDGLARLRQFSEPSAFADIACASMR